MDEAQFTDQAINHNCFVLEKHIKEIDDNLQRQGENEQEHYASPNDSTYEATYAEQENSYDTTDQSKSRAVKPGNPGNVYNTFNDFQQQDDYDHLDNHKKPIRVNENEYSTTQAALAPAIEDDTYNHLNQRPTTTPRPDNIYGMPRVDKDYDRMSHVRETNAWDILKGDVSYSRIGKL